MGQNRSTASFHAGLAKSTRERFPAKGGSWQSHSALPATPVWRIKPGSQRSISPPRGLRPVEARLAPAACSAGIPAARCASASSATFASASPSRGESAVGSAPPPTPACVFHSSFPYLRTSFIVIEGAAACRVVGLKIHSLRDNRRRCSSVWSDGHHCQGGERGAHTLTVNGFQIATLPCHRIRGPLTTFGSVLADTARAAALIAPPVPTRPPPPERPARAIAQSPGAARQFARRSVASRAQAVSAQWPVAAGKAALMPCRALRGCPVIPFWLGWLLEAAGGTQ